MTDDPENRQDGTTAGRPARREDRRARVGILPNPQSAPPPLPRKVPLMGRWPSLRSSRRKPPGNDALAAPAPRATRGHPVAAGTTAGLVQQGPDGGIRVDLERLDAAIRDLDGRKPGRAPYAARYRADLAEPPAKARMRQPASRPVPVPGNPAATDPGTAPPSDPRPAEPALPGRPARPLRALLPAALALVAGLVLLSLAR